MKLYLLLVAILSIGINCQITQFSNYSTTNGIQVYYLKTSDAFLYATYEGDASQIRGTIHLYLSQAASALTTGYYAGVGLGKSVMTDADMVICTASNNNFSCLDYYSPGNSRFPQLDSVLANGDNSKNNVSTVGGSQTTLSAAFSPYQTYARWEWIKTAPNNDQYDWNDFRNWQTNKGATAGSYGYLNSSGDLNKHVTYSNPLTIEDGAGAVSIFGGSTTTVKPTDSVNLKISMVSIFMMLLIWLL